MESSKAAPLISTLQDEFNTAWQQMITQSYGEAGTLNEAITYALSNQGKQVRPLFCLLTAKILGADQHLALRPAVAVEMVHTYSLIHDDLPCMDDDHLRRGKPTLHIAYDEATAVLVGDALLTDAFLAICDRGFAPELPLSAVKAGLVQEVARAAGSRGMVKGQALDLTYCQEEEVTVEQLESMHLLKTGQLLGAACACGAIIAKGDDEVVERFRRFGQLIGLAFQIVDDILDGSEGTGKSSGKDEKQNKLTFTKAFSVEQSHALAKEMTDRALMSIEGLGLNVQPLVQLALGLLERRY